MCFVVIESLSKLKKACRKNGRPFGISSKYPHGCVAHDLLNLEKRHHHALNTFFIFLYFT
jgi:hypothetical protein